MISRICIALAPQKPADKMKQRIQTTKPAAQANNNKKVIYAMGYLLCSLLTTHQANPALSADSTQNHTNFAKALRRSCEKKMPKETCKCYADKIIKRYNEIQVVSIYQKMIKNKSNQEMFFLTTSPELLYCMDNKN